MSKTLGKQRGGNLVRGIKTLSLLQLLLYAYVLWVAVASRDQESNIVILDAVVPYYLFILLGAINVMLITVYFYLKKYRKQRIDRAVLWLLGLLVLLVVIYVPLMNKLLY